MMAPSAAGYVLAVVDGDKELKADTVLMFCGDKQVKFKISPCMSGNWQCEQVSKVLRAIIEEAYNAGIRDAKA